MDRRGAILKAGVYLHIRPCAMHHTHDLCDVLVHHDLVFNHAINLITTGGAFPELPLSDQFLTLYAADASLYGDLPMKSNLAAVKLY